MTRSLTQFHPIFNVSRWNWVRGNARHEGSLDNSLRTRNRSIWDWPYSRKQGHYGLAVRMVFTKALELTRNLWDTQPSSIIMQSLLTQDFHAEEISAS